MSLELAVLLYAVMHVVVFGINVYRGLYPQVIKLGLVGLGVWAGWRLVG